MIDPCIVELPLIEKFNLTELDENLLVISKLPPIIKTSLGYSYFFNRTMDRLKILKKLENPFYLITLGFQDEIKNYQNNILYSSNKYFNIKDDDITIKDKNFYTYWEIFVTFNLIDDNKSTYVLSTSDGAFQALVNYRLKYFDLNYNKIYFNQSNNLTKFYSSKYKNINSYNNLTELVNKKINTDLVLFDINVEDNNKNNGMSNELSLLIPLLENISSTFKILNKKGNYIIKLYDTFDDFTLKVISLIISNFEHSYIIKPFSSNLLKYDKYLICKGYKLDINNDIDKKKIQNIVNTITQIITNYKKSSKMFINDIFPEYKLDKNFVNTIVNINSIITNLVLIQVNKTLKYISNNNYFGEEYHKYYNKQIEYSEIWITKYYPIDKLSNTKDNIDTNFNIIIKKNKNNFNILNEKLL